MLRRKFAVVVLSCVFGIGLASPAPAQTSLPANVVQTSAGKIHPAPGYAWATSEAGDFRVNWQPGIAHFGAPNVVAGDLPGKFRAAPGYRFANDLPGDLTVVPVGVINVGNLAAPAAAGPDGPAQRRAVGKILGAIVAHAAAKESGNDFGVILATTIRDNLIISALDDLFPQLNGAECATAGAAFSLAIDGNWSADQWARSTTRANLMGNLRAANPDAATAVEVVDFIGKVIASRP